MASTTLAMSGVQTSLKVYECRQVYVALIARHVWALTEALC